MPAKKTDDPLFAALDAKSLPALQAALAAGSSPDAKKGKESALAYAFSRRSGEELVRALIEAGADVRPISHLIVWAAVQPLPVLEKFLAAGADVNSESMAGRPLQAAARAGLLPQVQRLIGAGADLDAGTMIGNPLSDALKHGYREVALTLLRAGAKPAAGEKFAPLLARLAELGDAPLVRAMLEAGADPNLRYTLRGPHPREQKLSSIKPALKAIATAVAHPAPPVEETHEQLSERLDAVIQAKVDAATAVRAAGATALHLAAKEGALEVAERCSPKARRSTRPTMRRIRRWPSLRKRATPRWRRSCDRAVDRCRRRSRRNRRFSLRRKRATRRPSRRRPGAARSSTPTTPARPPTERPRWCWPPRAVTRRL